VTLELSGDPEPRAVRESLVLLDCQDSTGLKEQLDYQDRRDLLEQLALVAQQDLQEVLV